MVFGRLVLLLRAETFSLVKPSWVTRIFVCGDVVSFFVQVIGAAMFARSGSGNQGKTVLLIGLMAQIVFFCFFVSVVVVFHRRLARSPSPMAIRLDNREGKKGWKSVIVVIYLTSILIFVRSLFRFIEFTAGSEGPLLTHEVYFYIFDSLPMIGVLSILIPFHPIDYVPNKRGIMDLQREGLPLS